MTSLTMAHAAWIKLDLLARGIGISPSTTGFGKAREFAARKNFYNTPLWQIPDIALPQELLVFGLVVGLNNYGASPWELTWHDSEGQLLLKHLEAGIEVHPQLIPDLNLFRQHPRTARLANLYGGAALAFFSPRACYFFADGTECRFCSLAGTAAKDREFSAMLSPEDIRSTVQLALREDPGRIEQVMIVGGNMRDLDRGFLHHVALAAAAHSALTSAGIEDKISIHIATMPPKDLNLLEELRSLGNLHVMFNLEVWDPKRFEEICPGKAKDYGRLNMLRALERLRDTIGAFRAHSLLVTGLESSATTLSGAEALAAMGISPLINIYHSDRHSSIGLGKRPSFNELASIASGLQALYDRFSLRPYWRSCGRNAIDAEVERGLFRAPMPAFLQNGGPHG